MFQVCHNFCEWILLTFVKLMLEPYKCKNFYITCRCWRENTSIFNNYVPATWNILIHGKRKIVKPRNGKNFYITYRFYEEMGAFVCSISNIFGWKSLKNHISERNKISVLYFRDWWKEDHWKHVCLETPLCNCRMPWGNVSICMLQLKYFW